MRGLRVLLLTSLAAAACGRGAPDAGTLRVLAQFPAVSSDPQRSDDNWTQALLANVYEPLVRLDAAGTLEPALATSWTNPDARTWRLELRPDVVVADIGMPLLNGLDAGEQLKALHPGIKVVVLTQNREPRFAVEAFRRHASGYVLKDAAASELTAAIRAALAGKSYISPSIARSLHEEPPDGQLLARALSAREREVLQLLAEGKSMKEVVRFTLSSDSGSAGERLIR